MAASRTYMDVEEQSLGDDDSLELQSAQLRKIKNDHKTG